jgi:hypothetical protein
VRSLTYCGFVTLAVLTPRPTPTLAWSDWIFLAALAVAVFETLARSRNEHLQLPKLIFAGGGLILIGALLSLPNSADGTESIAFVARFIYVTVVWFALAGYALRTTGDVSTAVRLWVGSAALSGAAAVAQLLGTNVVPGAVIANGRMTGFSLNPSDLGGVCAVALIPAVALLDVHGHSLARRIASAVLVALVAAGLLLAGSVDGFIAAAVGLAIWLWAGGAGRRGVGALLGLAALFSIVAGAVAQLGLFLPIDRIVSVLSSPNDPNATFYTRLATFDLAWRWIGASPVSGVGFDPASSTTAAGIAVHNILIATWFEGGIFALLGVVLVLLAAAGTAWRAWAGSKSIESRRLGAALLAAFGSSIAFSMGNPIMFQRYIWVPVFLAIALVSHQARARVSASRGEAAFSGGVGRATRSAQSQSKGCRWHVAEGHVP